MALDFKDYYQTLGVPRTATPEEIKKAFRKLARESHPDVVKPRERAAAEARFKEINEAYEILSDPENRRKYDELGASWDTRGGGAAGPPPRARGPHGGMRGQPAREDFRFDGTGFSDFFEAFFGGGRKGGDAAPRGRDAEADIMVTIEEAISGSVRQIAFRRAPDAPGESYKVRIPPGVREGQRIRLAGQGGESGRGGGRGDLFLRVRLAAHPDYRLEGNDLVCEFPLPAWDAALGAEVEVPTPGGKARLKIPAGTQGGQRFRIRGLGMPAGEGARGDFFAVARIEIPKRLDASQREAWEGVARASKS